MSILKSRRVSVLGRYDTTETENGGVEFTVKPLGSLVTEGYAPRLYYDGGEHALLLKNEDTVAVCDHVHPGIRNLLYRSPKVRVFEISSGELSETYQAEVQRHSGIDNIAGELIRWVEVESRADSLAAPKKPETLAQALEVITQKNGTEVLFDKRRLKALLMDYGMKTEPEQKILEEIAAYLDRKPEKRGNTIGNIVNFGIAATDGDWIYHRNMNHDEKLYKTHMDGTLRQKLTDDMCDNISVISGWVYYSNHSDGGALYSVGTDGTDRQRLCGDKCGYISVVGIWVYYCNENDGDKPYKILITGEKRQKLCDDKSGALNAVGDWIYYYNEDDGCGIYKMRTDGTDRQKLTGDTSLEINASGDWVYYLNFSDGQSIYRIRTGGTDRQKLNDDKSLYLNVSGDFIYYSNLDDGGKMYRMQTDGTQTEKLNDENTHFINIVGEWIYYSHEPSPDSNLEDYMIRTDGSGRKRM